MGSTAPIIEANGLVKTFPSRTQHERIRAVDGVDLSVAPNEMFGLVGPDGAGKTTILRLLNGLLLPDAGRATVAGYDAASQSLEIHARAGYMAQQFSLYGDLSVYENIAFFARIYGVGRAVRQERIDRLLEFARLNPFRSRPAAKLSGGMKKKLALACMLVHEPEVVFLDEPTTGVDPVSRREFWDLLSSLRVERKLTMVLSTPYMDEAERCHRVGLLYRGRLIATGTPAEIKSLVPGQLLELRAADWQRAKELLGAAEGVLEVQTYGDRLHVFVDDADRRAPQLAQTLARQGIACQLPRRMAPRLEEAFVSLIRREGERQT